MQFCKCRWVENKLISLKMLNNLPFYILIFNEYVPNVHILSSSENLTKKFVYVLPSDRRVTICLPPGYDNLWIKIALKLIAPTGFRPVPSCVHWLCTVGEYVSSLCAMLTTYMNVLLKGIALSKCSTVFDDMQVLNSSWRALFQKKRWRPPVDICFVDVVVIAGIVGAI